MTKRVIVLAVVILVTLSAGPSAGQESTVLVPQASRLSIANTSSVWAFEPTSLTIAGGGGMMLVTIHPDGRLEYGPDYTPDAAARALWEAVAQARTRNMTLPFSDELVEAATRRVGAGPENETAQELKARIEAWALQQITNNLQPELTALRVEKAEAIEAEDDQKKAWTDADCAAVNALLKTRGRAPLKRCGGGGMP